MANHLEVGDIVKIAVDPETLEKCQEGHGGYEPGMATLIGRAGRVQSIDPNGDVRVKFKSQELNLNPMVLSTVRKVDKRSTG